MFLELLMENLNWPSLNIRDELPKTCSKKLQAQVLLNMTFKK